jgi:hypothetical protein
MELGKLAEKLNEGAFAKGMSGRGVECYCRVGFREMLNISCLRCLSVTSPRYVADTNMGELEKACAFQTMKAFVGTEY